MNNSEKVQAITRLVEGIQQGDERSLKTLMQLVQLDLQKLAMSFLYNVEQAEDVVSETFLTIIKKCNSLKSLSNVWGWIKTITVNKCLNILSKRKRETSLDELREINSQFEVESKDNLDEKMHVRWCLSKLDKQERIVLLLHAEGYTYEEIASLTRLTIKQVRLRLKKGKENFKKLYDEC